MQELKGVVATSTAWLLPRGWLQFLGLQCSFPCSGCAIALALPGCSSSDSRDPRGGADCLGSSVLSLCLCHSPDRPKRRGQALAWLSEEKELLGRSVLPSEDPAACWAHP